MSEPETVQLQEIGNLDIYCANKCETQSFENNKIHIAKEVYNLTGWLFRRTLVANIVPMCIDILMVYEKTAKRLKGNKI